MPTPEQASEVSAPPCVVPADHSQWFSQEVHPHDNQLRAYLRGKYPTVHDVDDVVQESYLRVWRAKAAQPIRSAKAFLFQIAQHIVIDLLRHNRASPIETLGDLSELSVLDDSPGALDAVAAQERLDLLCAALLHLPERCRQVVVLHKLKGLSQREVATRLGLSERTVENHCHQGLIRCQQYLRTRGVKNFQFD